MVDVKRVILEVLGEIEDEALRELEKYKELKLEELLYAYRTEACSRIDAVAERMIYNMAQKVRERVRDKRQAARLIVALANTVKEVAEDLKRELGCNSPEGEAP